MFVTSANYQTFNVPFVAITKQNSKTVEKELANDPKYNGKKYGSYEPKGRFCGSDAYWQKQIKTVNNGTFAYDGFIKHLVEVVDRSNDTHLSSAKNGRIEMAKAITKNYKNLNDFKKALAKNPFVNGNVDLNHIFRKLAAPLSAVRGGNRSNPSFASKLCQFASKILNAGYEYSKYDSVVSSTLPSYINEYLGVQLDEKHFSMNGKDFDKKMKTYAEYCDYIDKIIAVACPGMTREEFDHIVWYTNK